MVHLRSTLLLLAALLPLLVVAAPSPQKPATHLNGPAVGQSNTDSGAENAENAKKGPGKGGSRQGGGKTSGGAVTSRDAPGSIVRPTSTAIQRSLAVQHSSAAQRSSTARVQPTSINGEQSSIAKPMSAIDGVPSSLKPSQPGAASTGNIHPTVEANSGRPKKPTV
ncbi:hypothetical protein C8J57DRAFT_1519472 [Mycena rebaudengoi]|nr:hypothetical protein C8J57DRAFT_1519472 [Mycena rebaudengoi]